MSERQLKLVWVNNAGMAVRKSRRGPAPSPHAPSRKTPRKRGDSGAALWPSRKQLLVGVIGVVLIAMVGLFCGMWAIVAQNLEARILQKAAENQPLVMEITRRVEESETLRAAIANQIKTGGKGKEPEPRGD